MAATEQRFPAGASPSPEHECVSVQTPPKVTVHVQADVVSMGANPVERIEDVPIPAPADNRSTKGYCQKCNRYLGEFYNSWCRITGSYYVPALRGSYRSLLVNSGRQQAAARGTDLEGCTIQPVCCPALCTESPFGFSVVDAPPGKRHYRDRDFFKLSRIELRCELSPTQVIIVKPLEHTSKDLLKTEDSFSPSPTPEPSALATFMAGVAMDSLPPRQGYQHAHQESHRDLTYEQAMVQHRDNNRRLSISTAARSPQTSTARPNSRSKAQNHQGETPPQLTQPTVEKRNYKNGSFTAPVSAPLTATHAHAPDGTMKHSPYESRKSQHQPYPRSPPEVSLDAIQRLQTQISQNSGALAAHTRDIRRGEESHVYLGETLRREFSSQIAFQSGELQRVDGAVVRLSHEIQAMRQVLESLKHELNVSRAEGHPQQHPGAPSAQQASGQDSAIELMAQQLLITTQKANEVDMLKITIEIMKNKIQRLEETDRKPSGPGPVLQPVNLREPTSAQPSPELQPHHPFTTHATTTTTTPETTLHHDHVPSQNSGWAAVNSGVKRSHGTEVDNLYNIHAQIPSSAKRQRLTTESAPSFVSSTLASHTPAQDSQSQFMPPVHPLPSQPRLNGSVVSTQSQPPSNAPFGTHDYPQDDSWRAASQRDVEHRPRDRGRGGGPGSRGGRVRKSMPVQFHSPDWEREDWRGASESQTLTDGFYNHAVRGTPGIARRGTGGGGGSTRRGYTPSTDRAMTISGTLAIGVESGGETYEVGKKTRTKPVRNADGILIRKDGRPDMRSQSSAANLRKVHARREGESESSPSGTPTHLQDHASTQATETPSPSGRGALETAKSKHDAIMGKMFPRGVDESRLQHDYTRELFDKGHEDTIHSRAQTTRSTAKSSLQIKSEHVETHPIADTQSPHEEEVRAETTPRDSSPGIQVQTLEAQRTAASGSPTSRSESQNNPAIPETQSTDAS